MMKANKQIGFIYKNEESIDKILKDGDVVFERGFLREQTNTTLPIIFGGVGKDLKDYKIYGNTKQQLLPNGYTQVDYIESDTNSYIDMGLKGNQNTKIATSVLFKNGGTFVGDITDSSQAISLRFSPNNSGAISRFGDNSVTGILAPYSLNTRYLIETSSSGVKVDNNMIHQWQNITPFETVLNLYLFRSTTASASMLMCLYSCKVYDNNVLVRDFIPCYRNSDNEIGLYDLINNVFYTNQGTGVFTYGSVAPTPDAPIEMVSCGDRTKNLCGELEQGSYNETTGAKITSSNYRNKEPIKVLPSTNYIFSINGVGQAVNVLEYKVDGTYIGRIGSGTVSSNSYFTTSSETGYINIFRGASAGIEKWQIEQNDTISSYEPYGYKIPVNVRSDNLFDKEHYNYISAYLSNSNIITAGGEGTRCLYVKCNPNTTYNVSKTSLFGNDRFCLFDTSSLPNIGDTALSYVGTRSGNNNSKDLTITTNPTAQYLCIFVKASTTAPSASMQEIANTLQIVEGSTTPSKYIPYYNETTNIHLDEPLRKIGEYTDYIDFKNSKVIRNIGKKMIDGSLNWITSQFASGKRIYTLATTDIDNNIKSVNENSNKALIIADKYKTESIEDILTVTKQYAIGLSKTNYLSIQNQAYTRSADLIQSLTDNPVELCYALSTPVEETITLPNIPTIDGNNTFNIETELTPSQVYIKYKSNA